MASQSRRNSKGYSGASSDNGRKGSKEATPELAITSTTISAPKYGTVVPERVFVGGISPIMTEMELTEFFSKYGKVVDTKIIVDRAGVSKGYGFITFETEEEAKKLLADADNIMLRERKLNIARAIKKQSFNTRLDMHNGAANVVSTPLFPFAFPNGVTYFCHHGNGTTMQAPQPPTPQPPPPQAPPPTTPTTHLDPNLYTGYGGIQAAPPQYHQVVYPSIYYQAAQYQYPITTCEAIEGGLSEGGAGLQGGAMSAANPPVGQVLLAHNGYYLQEINPYQDYAYPPQYIYQPAPEPQPQAHHTALIQYSPAAATPTAPPVPPRPLYDSPVMVPENIGDVRLNAGAKHSPPHHGVVHHTHHVSTPQHPIQKLHVPQHQHMVQQHVVAQHHASPQPVNKAKEMTSRHNMVKTNPSHIPHPDPNNNQAVPVRSSYPHQSFPNPNSLGSQVLPHTQGVYPRPPSASNPSYPHYSNSQFNNNSAGTFIKKFRRPYNPQGGKGRGGGRGGGSVSSYSSGGGGGIVTPPSTPRSGQPSPDNQSTQTNSQDHLVHSMKTLKAA